MSVRLPFLIFLSFSLWSYGCGTTTPDQEEEKQMTDEELLDLTERQTFQYFWSGAEPVSGLSRERFHVDGVYPMDDKNVITSGGGGFGVMAIVAAMDRGYVTREEGVERLERITTFLENADRFHGVWPHWMYGETGKVKPFSPKDDGGDIVETSYMAQGLLCARQYLMKGNENEKALAARMDTLWREIDWDFYRNGKNILYWHWSPNFAWEMNFGIEGYNECLITYVLAASSPTHGVPAEVYHEGWARNGGINGTTTKYGFTLALRHNGAPEYGGPLFWSHYAFLGLDPRNLKDRYADYWEHNRNHVLIDRQYCIENPGLFKGYGENCWGLTSSYSPKGYAGHKPEEDLGVISPTAALSSFPYTPEYSMDALRHFYYDLGDKIWGEYGFYDAFSEQENWFPQKYLAIDQGPIVVMIENHRSGLLWDLFMSCPEVQAGLDKLGFTYQ
ncbi:MAG: glucoamylase family protein [Bacteroidia bacterium]